MNRTGEGGRIHVRAGAIYILPTHQGVIYAVAVFVMLLGSLNYSSNLGLLFSFVFAGVGIINMFHTWRNLLGLELSVSSPAPVFAGGTAVFSGKLALAEAAGKVKPRIRVSAGKLDGVLVDAFPDGASRFDLSVAVPQRGEIPLGHIRISTVSPLGLMQAWCYALTAAKVLVYPMPSPPRRIVPYARYAHSDRGDRGIGADDFVGLRPYRSGDSPMHLDWKALARERGLVVRQFGGDRAEQFWLDWDSLSGLDAEKRLSRLCRMVLDAAGDDIRYGMALPGIRIPPTTGDAHKHQCLSALARFDRRTVRKPGFSHAYEKSGTNNNR